MYSYFEDNQHVYLVLELCHNGELQRYLKRSMGGLPEVDGGCFFFLIY